MDKKVYRTIVFAGDSTTDAGKNSSPDGSGSGYVSLIKNALAAFRPWETNKVVNAGVNGNTSRDLLRRYDADVLSFNPDIVFCMIGINDVWRQIDLSADEKDLVYPEEYAKNLKLICEKTCGGSKLIFMTPFFMERNRQDEMRMLTERYIEIMRDTAKKCNVPIIDVQAAFDEYMNYRSGITVSWDRVHPEAVGNQIIARKVWEALETIF